MSECVWRYNLLGDGPLLRLVLFDAAIHAKIFQMFAASPLIARVNCISEAERPPDLIVRGVVVVPRVLDLDCFKSGCADYSHWRLVNSYEPMTGRTIVMAISLSMSGVAAMTVRLSASRTTGTVISLSTSGTRVMVALPISKPREHD